MNFPLTQEQLPTIPAVPDKSRASLVKGPSQHDDRRAKASTLITSHAAHSLPPMAH